MPLYRLRSTPRHPLYYMDGYARLAVSAAQLEVIDDPPLARGWIWTLQQLPVGRYGELVIPQPPRELRFPNLLIICSEKSLGLWRSEFSTDLHEQPGPWVGPGIVPKTLDELIKLWAADLGTDGASTPARFDREGKFIRPGGA